MNKVVTLRLVIEAVKKKLAMYEAELELLYHQLDEEEEKTLTNWYNALEVIKVRANISDELMDAIEERIYLDLEIYALTKRLHKAQSESNELAVNFFDKLISEVVKKRIETNDYLKQNGIKIFDPQNIDDMFVRYHYSQKVNGGFKEGYQQYWKAALKLQLKRRMSKYFYTGGV